MASRETPATRAAQAAGIAFTVHVSAGRRGLEIELRPADLVALTGAEIRALAAR
jgi:Cys-tRNA(Pro)/Cys-tRNA(Cys) deacylase